MAERGWRGAGVVRNKREGNKLRCFVEPHPACDGSCDAAGGVARIGIDAKIARGGGAGGYRLSEWEPMRQMHRFGESAAAGEVGGRGFAWCCVGLALA
jgi:hypothetical protein